MKEIESNLGRERERERVRLEQASYLDIALLPLAPQEQNVVELPISISFCATKYTIYKYYIEYCRKE